MKLISNRRRTTFTITILVVLNLVRLSFAQEVPPVETAGFQLPSDESTTTDYIEAYYEIHSVGKNEKADSIVALDALIQEIADDYVEAYSPTRIIIQQDIKSSVVSILKHSYAEDIKKHLELLSEPSSKAVRACCRLPCSVLENVFEKRKKLAINIYKKARKSEYDLDLKSALMRYYFSLILLYSLPQEQVLFRGVDLLSEVPQRIRNLLGGIELTVESDYFYSGLERRAIISAFYLNSPVTALDLCYYDGQQERCAEGKDGKNVLQLSGNISSSRNITVQIKYSYDSLSGEIPAVGSLWNLVVRPRFRNDRSITLQNARKISDTRINLQLHNPDNCPVSQRIHKEAMTLIRLLEAPQGGSVRFISYNDPFLRQKMSRLMQYNHPTILGTTIEATINETFSGGWEVRRLPVLNQYSSLRTDRKNSVDYLILDFSADGKLVDVNYSVYETLYRDFVQLGRNLEDTLRREEIIKFLEKYRTAYLNRDLATVDTIFADGALIIVGRVLKNSRVEKKRWEYHRRANSPKPAVEYLILEKDKYLKRLKSLFNIQRDIHLGFSDFELLRMPNVPIDVYGISMRQDYASTTYSDIGYLFLLIDFYAENPQIHIRAWQPQEWDEEKLIRLTNYKYRGDW